MKLSTELTLTNLVLLVVLWYSALHVWTLMTIGTFALMIFVRMAGKRAQHKERIADIAEMKTRIRKAMDRARAKEQERQ